MIYINYFILELSKYKELTGKEPIGAVLQNWFYIKIKDEIEVLNNKLKDIRLDLYNDMGIRSIFKIL